MPGCAQSQQLIFKTHILFSFSSTYAKVEPMENMYCKLCTWHYLMIAWFYRRSNAGLLLCVNGP